MVFSRDFCQVKYVPWLNKDWQRAKTGFGTTSKQIKQFVLRPNSSRCVFHLFFTNVYFVSPSSFFCLFLGVFPVCAHYLRSITWYPQLCMWLSQSACPLVSSPPVSRCVISHCLLSLLSQFILMWRLCLSPAAPVWVDFDDSSGY